MKIKFFCPVACFLPGRAKDLSAPLYIEIFLLNRYEIWNLQFLGVWRIREKSLLASSWPSAFVSAVHTGRIYTRFDIGDFYGNLPRKFLFD